MFVQPALAHLQILGTTSLPLLTPCSLQRGAVVSDPEGHYLFSHCDDEHGRTFLVQAGSLVVLAGPTTLISAGASAERVASNLTELVGRRVRPSAFLDHASFEGPGLLCRIEDAAWSKATFAAPGDPTQTPVRRLVLLTTFDPTHREGPSV